eukprot:358660-Chlamydomonas_euryale.AAC.2
MSIPWDYGSGNMYQNGVVTGFASRVQSSGTMHLTNVKSEFLSKVQESGTLHQTDVMCEFLLNLQVPGNLACTKLVWFGVLHLNSGLRDVQGYERTPSCQDGEGGTPVWLRGLQGFQGCGAFQHFHGSQRSQGFQSVCGCLEPQGFHGSRGLPVLQRPAMRLWRLPSASAPGDAALEASRCFSALRCGSRGFPMLRRPAMGSRGFPVLQRPAMRL